MTRRIDISTDAATLFTITLMVALAVLSASWPIRAVCVGLAVASAFMLGLRRGRHLAREIVAEALGPLPKSIIVEPQDDGRVLAFVQSMDDEPAVYDMPPDVYAAGPTAVMTWLFNQTQGEP